MKKVRFFPLVCLALGISSQAFAGGNLAVVDSGTDVQHKDLKSFIWLNPLDSTVNNVDEDKNGYVDDINGWNFAENNNQLIDRKYIGTFSPDCYKFFDVQGRLLLGTGTDEDKAWYNEKIKDENFIKELTKFGNFTHGSHVSGIGVKDTQGVKVMGVKLIPTEQPGGWNTQLKPQDSTNDFLIMMLLQYAADNQIKAMKQIAQYVQGQKMNVANCSFGASEKNIREVIRQQLKGLGDSDTSDERVNRLAKSFFDDMLMPRGKEAFGDPAPSVLWVYAAGNDGSNNSELATFPANIKLDNTITVAATIGQQAIAKFSNFSTDLVEVAAPGVVIHSTIPGDEYLNMSGTSQAAPYVSNVAVQISAINSRLAPLQIKDILIKTVDKKDWLSDKVKSGGIINRGRAIEAAKQSLVMPLEDAIATANNLVNDVEPLYTWSLEAAQNIFVMPLPSPIRFN